MSIRRTQPTRCPDYLYMYVELEDFKKIVQNWRVPISVPWKRKDSTSGVLQHATCPNLNANSGYISLSSTCTSPSMWGYYAGRSTGVCLIFEIVLEGRVDPYSPGWYVCIERPDARMTDYPILYPVQYQKSRVVEDINNLSLYVESEEWRHEQEYRIIIPLNLSAYRLKQSNRVAIGVEEDNHINVYSESFMNFLRGIIIGPHCPLTKAKVESMLSMHGRIAFSRERRMASISITHAHINKKYFSFDVDTIRLPQWNEGFHLMNFEEEYPMLADELPEVSAAINSENRLVLYMYASFDDFRSIISSKNLRISRPWATNDITEGVRQNETARTEQIERYGYVCMSRTCTSPSMWSYYADGAKGVCLAFTFDDIKYSEELEGWKIGDSMLLKRVAYSHERCETDIVNDLLSIKSTKWQHEKEYRIIIPLKTINYDSCVVNDDGSIIYQTDELMKHLSGVILGWKCERKHEEIRVLLENDGITYGNSGCIPRITKAKLHESLFAFEVNEREVVFTNEEADRIHRDYIATKEEIYSTQKIEIRALMDKYAREEADELVRETMKEKYPNYLGHDL